jgi:hypothetical protein
MSSSSNLAESRIHQAEFLFFRGELCGSGSDSGSNILFFGMIGIFIDFFAGQG